MTKQPMFKQDPSDREGVYLLSMAGVLALVGATAYEADDAVTPRGRAISVAALPRGQFKVEVGDDVCEALTPRETLALSKLLGGVALAFGAGR